MTRRSGGRCQSGDTRAGEEGVRSGGPHLKERGQGRVGHAWNTRAIQGEGKRTGAEGIG
jgi:hypothetical protein